MKIGKLEAVILAIGLILAAIAYQISAKIADSVQVQPIIDAVVSQPTPAAPVVIVIEQPTQPAPIAQPVQPIQPTQTPIALQPTYDATAADFFAWQTAQAEQPNRTGLIGQGTPTPAGSVGVHDPGRTDKRTP